MQKNIIIEVIGKHKFDLLVKDSDGNEYLFDPFVSCAIKLSDDDVTNFNADDYLGKKYILKDYWVSRHCLIPEENGLIEL